MTIGSDEHYAILAAFDKWVKSAGASGIRSDISKEDRDFWKTGNVYKNGEVNNAYKAFINGYAYAKCALRED